MSGAHRLLMLYVVVLTTSMWLLGPVTEVFIFGKLLRPNCTVFSEIISKTFTSSLD